LKFSFIGAAEAVLLLIALMLGILWMKAPDGTYEPYLAFIGTILMVLEVIRRNRKKVSLENSTENGHSVTKPEDHATFRVSEITVNEIVEEINSSPPFQKESVSKRYNGLGVNWFGYLHTASPSYGDDNKVTVKLRTAENLMDSCYIWFDINLADLPEVQFLKNGSGIRIKGEIIRASGEGLCVTLKPVEVVVGNA
jgi:hypothetical protein